MVGVGVDLEYRLRLDSNVADQGVVCSDILANIKFRGDDTIHLKGVCR